MKKIVRQNKKGWYKIETEIETKDVLFLLFWVVVFGIAIFSEVFL
jgi:hypothetical protein